MFAGDSQALRSWRRSLAALLKGKGRRDPAVEALGVRGAITHYRHLIKEMERETSDTKSSAAHHTGTNKRGRRPTHRTAYRGGRNPRRTG